MALALEIPHQTTKPWDKRGFLALVGVFPTDKSLHRESRDPLLLEILSWG